MTNTQLFAILLPIVIGILINLNGNSRLESRLNSIDADLRRFWQILGEHGADIETLKKR